MKIRLEATAPAGVDVRAREVRGLALPWNVSAQLSGLDAPVRFVRGSIERAETPFLRDHDPRKVIGRAMEWADSPKGLHGRFKIARTAAGEDTLALAEDQMIDGLSIGADVFDYFEHLGEIIVRAAIVRETSLVVMPAYLEARIGNT